MRKIGLKLWSTNVDYIYAAADLYRRNMFDYLELFTVPGSTETLPLWKKLGVPYVLHAPHSAAGLNVSDSSSRNTNLTLVEQVEEFFHALSPAFVIFHPGEDGDLRESIFQIRAFGVRFPKVYQKVVIENNPKIGLEGQKCIGASPEEIRLLLEGTGRGFCLDFSHAACYSVSAKKEWKEELAKFSTLGPQMYHLCDGFFSEKDNHQHLGEGEFDLTYLVGLIGRNSHITLETNCASKNLQEFINDAEFLRTLINS